MTFHDSRIEDAIVLAVQYAGIDGGTHNDWVIDQMLRILAGSRYAQVVQDACSGVDGPNTYTWTTGVAP